MSASYNLQVVPDELEGVLRDSSRPSGFQGGRPLNIGPTVQGGGPVAGGGIVPPVSSAWLGIFSSSQRKGGSAI